MCSMMRFDGNLHSLELWHKRLAHPNVNSVEMLKNIASQMDVRVVQGNMHLFACE